MQNAEGVNKLQKETDPDSRITYNIYSMNLRYRTTILTFFLVDNFNLIKCFNINLEYINEL